MHYCRAVGDFNGATPGSVSYSCGENFSPAPLLTAGDYAWPVRHNEDRKRTLD